jgi:hypothetical protein
MSVGDAPTRDTNVGFWHIASFRCDAEFGCYRGMARGDAEIGFQQVSELKPMEGIDIISPLPDELQKITVFSAGIASVSKELDDAGKALIKFLASPAARGEIVKSGMDRFQ